MTRYLITVSALWEQEVIVEAATKEHAIANYEYGQWGDPRQIEDTKVISAVTLADESKSDGMPETPDLFASIGETP